MPNPNPEPATTETAPGAVVFCVLSGEAAARVVEAARQSGKTPQQVIVAAVTALLTR